MAEGNGLLNRRTSNACTAGSNPALSVIRKAHLIWWAFSMRTDIAILVSGVRIGKVGHFFNSIFTRRSFENCFRPWSMFAVISKAVNLSVCSVRLMVHDEFEMFSVLVSSSRV